MSLSVHASPWAEDKGVLDKCDEELRLCLDRSSDSDSQQELNRSLNELIESITCKDDDDPPSPPATASEVVSDIVERLLDRVESAGAARWESVELECDAREIDCEGSRDKAESYRKADTPKRLRRKRDRSDHERKKLRRRSTSCSTSSSACSDISRHRRKHKHPYERDVEEVPVGPSPRVNPIFLWVKQDDTRIVEVLCEDYDKRNRIRLTKTAHGWRSMPRTERLDSTLSRSSVELSPTVEPEEPSLVTVKTEPDELVQTKENKKRSRKRYASGKKKRCDRKRDKGFNNENRCVDSCINNVDVVNNNNSSNNNNNLKQEDALTSESNLSDPKSRSFGYKNASHHGQSKEGCIINKKKDNKLLDIDVYTFVSTPKTDSDDDSMDQDFDSETELRDQIDLNIKSEPIESEPEDKECKIELKQLDVETERPGSECRLEDSENMDLTNASMDDQAERLGKSTIESPNEPEEKVTSADKNLTDVQLDKSNTETNVTMTDSPEEVEISHIKNIQILKIPQLQSLSVTNEEKEDHSGLEDKDVLINSPNYQEVPEPLPESVFESKLSEPIVTEGSHLVNSTTTEDSRSSLESKNDQEEQDDEEKEPQEETELPPEVILPEPHLLTPEPSPQPLPEQSTAETNNIFPEIFLQPDTSLDSDNIHLPDTTTKSESSLLVTTDLSLGQQLSLKPDPILPHTTSLPTHIISSDQKANNHTENLQHSQTEVKTAEMLQQEEIQRQITADLDEDHLLAIEEILQGEECVEDFDDLPEEYSVSDESPVNLVIDLKAKDQIGIPLSLRTDDFLEIFPSAIPMKEHSDMLSPIPPPKSTQETAVKPIPPAHQQSKTKFLESILSCPKKCHKDDSKKADAADQQEPLYLGVSRKSASPTVSSSDCRKFSSPELEPKPKRIKVDDITLKTILSRNKDTSTKIKATKSKDTEETQQTADSTTKSRLLELLTSENDEHISKLDPLTQLKEVLSDPDLHVPDPLLVPRTRLPALVANPAKEIPRLLAMKSEGLSYPKLLTDPDLLVVSLSHLQSLLQAAGKDEEMLKYQQQHAQLLQQQMKQDKSSMDAATATALNQMMWLPYLSQLEAAAMACGNSQDFMSMLNMMFPPGGYSQMNPYLMSSPTSGINPYDYKSQLEFQQAFALWNEAMMQAATNQFAAQSLGSSTPASNNNISKLYQNYQENKLTPKSHSNPISKHQEPKHAAARTSPISLNYPQNKYRSNQYPYTSMFSIPTSTPTTSHSSRSSNQYRTTQSSLSSSSMTSSQPQQPPYQPSRQRNYNYNYASLKTPTTFSSPINNRIDSATISAINPQDFYKQQKYSSSSLVNMLSKPKQSEIKHHHYPQTQPSKVYPTSTTILPRETTVKFIPSVKQEPPKLKVKQPQHLVDPNSRPKLLNFDEHGEVGSTTGSLTPHVDEAHPNLWHPLFSRSVFQ